MQHLSHLFSVACLSFVLGCNAVGGLSDKTSGAGQGPAGGSGAATASSIGESLELKGYVLRTGDVKADKDFDYPVSRFVIQVLDTNFGPVVGAKISVMRLTDKADGKVAPRDVVTDTNPSSNVFTVFIAAGADYTIVADTPTSYGEKHLEFNSSKPVDVSFPLTISAIDGPAGARPEGLDPTGGGEGFYKLGLKYCDFGSGDLKGDLQDLLAVLTARNVEGAANLKKELEGGLTPIGCESGRKFPAVNVSFSNLSVDSASLVSVVIGDASALGPDYYYGWETLNMPQTAVTDCNSDPNCVVVPMTPRRPVFGLKFCDTANDARNRYDELSHFMAILEDHVPAVYAKLKKDHPRYFGLEACESGQRFPMATLVFDDGSTVTVDVSPLREAFFYGAANLPSTAPTSSAPASTAPVSIGVGEKIEPSNAKLDSNIIVKGGAGKVFTVTFYENEAPTCGLDDYKMSRCQNGKYYNAIANCADGSNKAVSLSAAGVCEERNTIRKKASRLCTNICSKPYAIRTIDPSKQDTLVATLAVGRLHYVRVVASDDPSMALQFGPFKAGEPVVANFAKP